MGFGKGSVENLVMNPKFWKNKKVLLTGHTGFIGSWLSLWLKKLNADVIGFSNEIPTKPSFFEVANIESEMKSIMGDVRDYKHLESVIKEYQPEIVIHMAAQAILRQSYKEPTETYSTNVMGTVNLFEAIRGIDTVHVILNVTSDKCYEPKKTSSGFIESDPLGGYDPYSNSKACSELVTSSFRNSFFNPEFYDEHGVALASARAGNVIGGGDWGDDRLLPDIMKGILKGEKIRIRHPNAIRPWQFVLDPLHGYLILIENLWEEGPKFAQGWNFGPTMGDLKDVKWIIDKLNDLWDKKICWEIDKTETPHEEDFLKLDCSKAVENLGWNSKMNLEMTLNWTIEWYKAFNQGKNMREFSELQIDNFILNQ